MKTLYEVLGVIEQATADEIKAAYKHRSRETHPDRNAGDKAQEAEFIEVQSAYEVLSDATKRADYDQKLKASRLAQALVQWRALADAAAAREAAAREAAAREAAAREAAAREAAAREAAAREAAA